MWGIICKEILIYILIAYFSPSFFISHSGTELIKNLSRSLELKNVSNRYARSVFLRQIGHLVILDFYDIGMDVYHPGQDVVIAEGLPPAIWSAITTIQSYRDDRHGLRVGVLGTALRWWWNMDDGVGTDIRCSGQLMYFTNG